MGSIPDCRCLFFGSDGICVSTGLTSARGCGITAINIGNPCTPQKIHTSRIYSRKFAGNTQLLLPAHSWHAPSSMRTAHSLLRFVSILLHLAQDALQFLLLGTRSSAALKAENLFLRKQLALYLEREAKSRRATDACLWRIVISPKPHGMHRIIKGRLCLSKISKCLSGWGLFLLIILADAHFPHDTPHKSVFDLLFARCAPAGEPGSAPPNRRASAMRKKSPKIDSRRLSERNFLNLVG